MPVPCIPAKATLRRLHIHLLTVCICTMSVNFYGCSNGSGSSKGAYVPDGYRPEPPKSIPAYSYADRTPKTQIDASTRADIVAIRQVEHGLHVDVLIESDQDLEQLQATLASWRSYARWQLVSEDDPGQETIPLLRPIMHWRWSPSESSSARYTIPQPSNYLYKLDGAGGSHRFLYIMPHSFKADVPEGLYRLTRISGVYDDENPRGEDTPFDAVFEKDIAHRVGPRDSSSPLRPGKRTTNGSEPVWVQRW